MPHPYRVRFVNPQRQFEDHKDEFWAKLEDVFSRGDYIMRGDLEEFETKLAKMVGCRYAIGVNSGTDALTLSVLAADIGSGDEVITVGHTFMATLSCAYHTNASVKLIDITEDFNMDTDKLEEAITFKTKAIIPVHLNGRICNMEKIMALAQKYNLIVIEDAAQALIGKMRLADGSWKQAGTFGLAGCFSLYPFKALGAFGDAGIITTDNEELGKRVRLMRYNGEDREKRTFHYHGYTALLDNIQAALLNVKIKYYPGWVQRRREIAEIYHTGLGNITQIKIPRFEDNRYYDVYQNYVIQAEKRDELEKYLDDNGVETIVSWKTPTYRHELMQPNNYHLYLPVTEKIVKRILSLPIYPELTNEEVNYVIKVINDFYGQQL